VADGGGAKERSAEEVAGFLREHIVGEEGRLCWMLTERCRLRGRSVGLEEDWIGYRLFPLHQ